MTYEGYTFYRKRTNGVKDFWKCSTHHCKGCRASVISINNIIVKVMNYHNHQLRIYGNTLCKERGGMYC